MTNTEPTIFIVDDDPSVRKSLSRLLSKIGLLTETFPTAQAFLDRGACNGPACLILDIRMPGLSGLDLQKELRRINRTLPIIFITGHGNVPLSVQAMKAGAVDFLEKPFEEQTLIDAVHKAIDVNRKALQDAAEIREVLARIDSLTGREREVLQLVVEGMLNKQIAAELGTTERTIKAHRAQVMKKMAADSVAKLVRMVEKTRHLA